MNKESMTRELVLPGDLLDAGTMKPGEGTYVHDGKIFAAMLGIKSVKSNFVNVIPLGGRYIPAPGDMIIGKVIDIGPSNWLVDIYPPYPAPLHVTRFRGASSSGTPPATWRSATRCWPRSCRWTRPSGCR